MVLSIKFQPIRCDSCNLYRKTLLKISSRQKNVLSSAVKKTRPLSSCNKRQLRKRLFENKSQIRELQKQKRKLEKQVARSVKRDGIQLEKSTHKLVSRLSKTCPFPKDSVMYLLWEQQRKACRLSKMKSMRWHPIIIRWCLGIYLKSPGAYDHIRDTGFLKLPHRTTLNQYTNFTDIGTGYNPDVIKRLYDDYKLDDMPEGHRICTLLFDEMKIF
uniref:Uncharacterized protein n=1 Tax=Clytia hemisphaerica TaxID=252671 RepID=A0A7M5VE59_9CNID